MQTPAAHTHDLAMSLRVAYLALHRRTDAALTGCDVTADQFVVLSALARGDALTQRELVDRTSSDPSTLRAMLVLLEAKGLVERQPHPSDRRARSVRLSRRGRREIERMWAATEPVRAHLAHAAAPLEVTSLVAVLANVASAMGRQPIAPDASSGRSPPPDEGPTSSKGT